MKIFSGTANKPLSEKIAQQLDTSVSSLDIHIFPDGEKRIRIADKVLGEDCVVLQATSEPVDSNYMELFFIVDALRRSGAKSITAVIPYLGYQRQDHIFRVGEAVSLSVVEKTLESVGVNSIVTFDLHSVKTPEIFNIPVSHLSALPIFAKIIKEKGWDKSSAVLISPDMGGKRRIKILSSMLDNISYAVIEKNRDLETGRITADKIDGEVGKRAIIVDDMISTGGTIITAANLLKRNGAKEIIVFATHPVFSQIAPKLLQESGVESVYVTDTIFVPKEKRFPKLEILSVSEMIAKQLSF